MIELIISLIILAFAVPVGILLKSITSEEINNGKKYFKILWILCIIIALVLFFIDNINIQTKNSIIFSLFFIAIVAFISWK